MKLFFIIILKKRTNVARMRQIVRSLARLSMVVFQFREYLYIKTGVGSYFSHIAIVARDGIPTQLLLASASN